MENILVINDYSKVSLKVFEYAISVFNNKNIKLSLFDLDKGADLAVKQAMSNKRTLYDRKYSEAPELDLLCSLGKIIDRKFIDLLVITTKINSNPINTEKFIGDRVSSILTAGFGIPILLIPHELEYVHISNITFLTDYNRTFNSLELKEFIKIALMFKATINVFNISKKEQLTTNQGYNKEYLEAYLEDLEINYCSYKNNARGLAYLNQYLNQTESQLIAFVNDKRILFKKIIEHKGVYSTDLEVKTPLLVLPSINGNLT